MESRVNNRLASSVEELASIIKEYAKKHKKLSDRVQQISRTAKSPHNRSTNSPPVLDNSSKSRVNKSKLNTSRDNIANNSMKQHLRKAGSDKENLQVNVTTTTHNASMVKKTDRSNSKSRLMEVQPPKALISN